MIFAASAAVVSNVTSPGSCNGVRKRKEMRGQEKRMGGEGYRGWGGKGARASFSITIGEREKITGNRTPSAAKEAVRARACGAGEGREGVQPCWIEKIKKLGAKHKMCQNGTCGNLQQKVLFCDVYVRGPRNRLGSCTKEEVEVM